MKYLCYGYKFGVEKMDTGDWCACGHAKGKTPYVLDKLGSRLTEEAMQKALDAWARHVGASRVEVEKAGSGSQQQAEVLELFPQRVGCVV